jgi:hypothetical protein
VHDQLKENRKQLAGNMQNTKKEFWNDFLGDLTAETVWTAHKIVAGGGTDGGRTRMPPLRTTNIINQPTTAVTDEEKADVLYDAFFAKPTNSPPPDPNTQYPTPKFTFKPFTQPQVSRAIHKLKPYAAPGEDGVSNLVLQKCENLLLPILTTLFQASFDLQYMPERWLNTRTVAL